MQGRLCRPRDSPRVLRSPPTRGTVSQASFRLYRQGNDSRVRPFSSGMSLLVLQKCRPTCPISQRAVFVLEEVRQRRRSGNLRDLDLAKEEPRTPGGECGAGVERALPWSAVCLVAGREGKREFENLVVDEDAQVELLRVFVALEPDDAGDFFFGGDGLGLENIGLNLLGHFA